MPAPAPRAARAVPRRVVIGVVVLLVLLLGALSPLLRGNGTSAADGDRTPDSTGGADSTGASDASRPSATGTASGSPTTSGPTTAPGATTSLGTSSTPGTAPTPGDPGRTGTTGTDEHDGTDVLPTDVPSDVPDGSADLPPASVNGRSAAPLASSVSYRGVLGKRGRAAATSFTAYRGSPTSLVMDYLGSGTWAGISEASWMGRRWRGTSYHMVLSAPMLPSTGASLETGATGAYDHYWVHLAQDLVDGGLGNSTLRIGWEMTGDWFPWEATHDPAAYAAYWRHVVTAMRSVPGQTFTFDYTFSNQDRDPRLSYPGDAYVDFIGVDQYNSSYAVSYRPSDQAKVWQHHVSKPYGFSWMAAWAAEHHKRLTFPEWGLVKRCDGHGGGDNSYYLQRMRAWIDSHDVAYEVYFDDNDSGCKQFKVSDATLFPQGNAVYKQLWSGPATKRLGTTVMRVSATADRSGSFALNGSTLASGTRYLFAAAPAGTVRSEFWLDGEYSSAARHVDSEAPWDLVGGTVTAAEPFHLASLAPGGHTVTARFTSAAGVVTTTTASFWKR